jgi:hypothetical protein
MYDGNFNHLLPNKAASTNRPVTLPANHPEEEVSVGSLPYCVSSRCRTHLRNVPDEPSQDCPRSALRIRPPSLNCARCPVQETKVMCLRLQLMHKISCNTQDSRKWFAVEFFLAL